MTADSDTIFALASAPGVAGVAVVRVSGPAVGSVLHRLTGLDSADVTPRRAMLRALHDGPGGELIDRALLILFPAPGSFTGEDVLELHVHGGRAVQEALFAAIAAVEGTRMAGPGEFSRRAVANGRMDLTAAEGIADLVAAETAQQRRLALRQGAGELARLYDGWRTRLIGLLAHLEAWLDFPDEDLPDSLAGEVAADCTALARELRDHLQGARAGERIRDGLMVAIVGPPNAGKSSLLNALARRDVAIVTDIPGTTRDVLEVHLDLDGHAVTLVDTAGLRDSDDRIEQEGIRRARLRARSADMVLWLASPGDAGREADLTLAGDGAVVIPIRTKSDLVGQMMTQDMVSSSDLRVSSLTGDGIPELVRRMTSEAARLTEIGAGMAPTRMRHRDSLTRCLLALDRVASGSMDWSVPELIGEELRRAANELGRITGRVDVEDLLDVIFRDFCIGK